MNAKRFFSMFMGLITLSGCGAALQHPAESRTTRVCIRLQTAEDEQEAKRGIEWWGETVEFVSERCDVTVRPGATRAAERAMGWNDGRDIYWVSGPVYQIVRHEFGHILGYADTEYGVMASGNQMQIHATE